MIVLMVFLAGVTLGVQILRPEWTKPVAIGCIAAFPIGWFMDLAMPGAKGLLMGTGFVFGTALVAFLLLQRSGGRVRRTRSAASDLAALPKIKQATPRSALDVAADNVVELERQLADLLEPPIGKLITELGPVAIHEHAVVAQHKRMPLSGVKVITVTGGNNKSDSAWRGALLRHMQNDDPRLRDFTLVTISWSAGDEWEPVGRREQDVKNQFLNYSYGNAIKADHRRLPKEGAFFDTPDGGGALIYVHDTSWYIRYRRPDGLTGAPPGLMAEFFGTKESRAKDAAEGRRISHEGRAENYSVGRNAYPDELRQRAQQIEQLGVQEALWRASLPQQISELETSIGQARSVLRSMLGSGG